MARRVDGRRAPRNDAEWARHIDRRITELETGQSSQRIGNWVLTDLDGELVATDPTGRIVALTALTLSTTQAGDTVIGSPTLPSGMPPDQA